MMNSQSNPTDELRCEGCQTPIANLIPEPPRNPPECPQTLPNVLAALPDSESIRQSIASARQGIDVLDSRMKQLQELTERCKASRQRHEEYIEHSKGLLFSANRLPPEIWVQIFKLASKDSLDYMKTFASASPNYAPLSISHVSQEWRLLSLRTSSLWCNIALESEEDIPRLTLGLLSVYLTRGLSHKLDIQLRLDSYLDRSSMDRTSRALGMLVAHSSRWRSVFLDLPSCAYRLDHFPVAFTPNLESVNIATYDSYDCQADSEDGWSPSFLENAPNLKKVRMANFTLGSQEHFQRMLPWETVTSVELDSFVDDGDVDIRGEITHALSSCPRLQKLEYNRDRLADFSGSTAVLHDELTHLTLDSPGAGVSMITAPKLNSLIIKNVISPLETVVHELISRSKQLEVLTIYGKFGSLSNLRSSSLKELHIHILPYHHSNSSQALMSLSAADSSFLPHLSKIQLTLEIPIGRDSTDSLRLIPAISALAYKSSSSVPLSPGAWKVGVVVIQRNIPLEMLAALQNLKEINLDGLEIELPSSIYPEI